MHGAEQTIRFTRFYANYNIMDVNLKSHPNFFRKINRLCGLEYETIDYYFRHVLSKKHRNGHPSPENVPKDAKKVENACYC
jgi:hypothetical protein